MQTHTRNGRSTCVIKVPECKREREEKVERFSPMEAARGAQRVSPPRKEGLPLEGCT